MNDDRLITDEGAFAGHLAPGRTAALLIVDVVMAYLDPASPLFAAAAGAALASNERLVARARTAGMAIVFTNVVIRADGLDAGCFYRKVPALKAFVAGSPYGAFPPTLQPNPADIVVTKQYASAFFATSLASTLHAMGVDTLFLSGYSTSGCVRASTLDALQHGFIPFVVADACADRDLGPHEANLFDIQAKYGEVVDEASALALFDAIDANGR